MSSTIDKKIIKVSNFKLKYLDVSGTCDKRRITNLHAEPFLGIAIYFS